MKPTIHPLLQQRQAGVLLHLTSLPITPGNGDLGAQAYYFVDFLVSTACRVWQFLPISPTQEDRSPYQSTSAYAGDALLISLDMLHQWGWLEAIPVHDKKRHGDAGAYRRQMLLLAKQGFDRYAIGEDRDALHHFISTEQTWLRDYALFEALKKKFHNQPWYQWPLPYRDRHPDILGQSAQELAEGTAQVYFEQFVFNRQWHLLKAYANQKGVRLFGDMPIFVCHDSADVWANRQYFQINAAGELEVVAGVPPDYFSENGQRWGNPCYHWPALIQSDFDWWLSRFKRQIHLFDLIRVDHFRGFQAYWEIPATSLTAKSGQWVQAPGLALFARLSRGVATLPIIAEDLGVITPEVTALRQKFFFPGMRIFQFAFDGHPHNPHLPHNYSKHTVSYTGTHDNNTTLAWFNSLPDDVQKQVVDYLGYPTEAFPWPAIRAVLGSIARLAIIPLQDILALDGSHRMNQPGTSQGNWSWRFQWEQIEADTVPRLRHLVKLYNR